MANDKGKGKRSIDLCGWISILYRRNLNHIGPIMLYTVQERAGFADKHPSSAHFLQIYIYRLCVVDSALQCIILGK